MNIIQWKLPAVPEKIYRNTNIKHKNRNCHLFVSENPTSFCFGNCLRFSMDVDDNWVESAWIEKKKSISQKLIVGVSYKSMCFGLRSSFLLKHQCSL